jgi:hypothetical protein
MPATSCTNPVQFDLRQGPHGECQFVVELAWDGVSTPPNCNGVVSRVFFNNTHPTQTFYAHLPDTRMGKAVYQIVPGDSRNITNRAILHAAGLDDRSDVLSATGLYVNTTPPAADEILINP